MPLVDRLFAIIAPHECIVCASEGSLLCSWCAYEAFAQLPSRCYSCKRITSDYAVCDKCVRLTSLRHVWVRTEYSNVAKVLLRKYKYDRARAADTIVARAMDEVIPYLSPSTLIVSVPTATVRVRLRGYDQTLLLARSLARKRSCAWVRAVTRVTQARQVGATRAQRLNQLKDAFIVTKPELIKNADILIIDDVVTTGATLESVAKALKRAGAKSINAAVFAQKQ